MTLYEYLSRFKSRLIVESSFGSSFKDLIRSKSSSTFSKPNSPRDRLTKGSLSLEFKLIFDDSVR